jgi:hydroxypyruvate isomerase
MRIQQSLCIPMFKPRDLSLDEFCRTVASLGFGAVEIWGRDESFPELLAAAASHKLTVASMCGAASLTDGLNNRANHDLIASQLRQSIDLAAKHRIGGLICFSGNRHAGADDAAAIDACADGLKRVAPYAQAKGVNLNLELLNSKIDHLGYQCDHTAWGVAVCRKVASPRVKLLYDIYHMQIMEGDVIRTIRDNIAWIGHFHTAGVPGRNDMDDTQELNYAAICRAIAATGYGLYVGHEFVPRGDWIAALAAARTICDQH